MNKHIIIIDDEEHQAKALATKLGQHLDKKGFSFSYYHKEDEILNAVSDEFYSLAIVDIRMDNYKFDGIKLVDKIIESNPLAKIILVSAFTQEYFSQIKNILLSGKILDVQEKKDIESWSRELSNQILNYFDSKESYNHEINNTLSELYSAATLEKDSYQKGKKFEDFLNMLFLSMGYSRIYKRVKDITTEVDLVIRNDIDDKFLSKFGKYILVEAKNRPASALNKNDFVIFKSKIDSTNKWSELGILATTGSVAKTINLEALRTSSTSGKIILLSQNDFIKIISSENKISAFKDIIDTQLRNVNDIV